MLTLVQYSMRNPSQPRLSNLSLGPLLAMGLLCAMTVPCDVLCKAQEIEPVPSGKRYSDQVVAKADSVLAKAGLKRSGKTILVVEAANINRAISQLAKPRRELKQLQETWQQTANMLQATRDQFDTLNAQEVTINMQLAQAGLDVNTHNRLVASHNANVARMRQLHNDSQKIETKLGQDRQAVVDAETRYAQSVLALRSDLDALSKTLEEQLTDKAIPIATEVLAAQFGTPATLTTASLLGSLERRLQQLEKEVFSENIPLEVTNNGSLYVNVMIGDKPLRMVLDSGASVISLPESIAKNLGVTIPADAPALQLVTADGRSIPGHAVDLPSVRIGEFEATQVRAAVLEVSAENAEPLLGMSYLSQFKFEIDTAGKTLKLLRVAAE